MKAFSCSVVSYSLWPHRLQCSQPGSSVHGILQARILELVAMPSSSGSSQPRDQTQVAPLLLSIKALAPLVASGQVGE